MAKAAVLKEEAQLPWIDGQKVSIEAMKAAGIENPEQYIRQPDPGPSPEQLEKLAEIRIKEKDAETKRIAAVGKLLSDLANTDEKNVDNLLNMVEFNIAKDSLENAEDEQEPVPGLEG